MTRHPWRTSSPLRPSLSFRYTQVRDLEIGQPINSENCSETAEAVARASEGSSRLSLLRAVRQDQPTWKPLATCLFDEPVLMSPGSAPSPTQPHVASEEGRPLLIFNGQSDPRRRRRGRPSRRLCSSDRPPRRMPRGSRGFLSARHFVIGQSSFVRHVPSEAAWYANCRFDPSDETF